ncbi:transcriptional regulator [Halobacteroides halobius DSM 5150]|uniref:Transcriptional regulator n=1 Tax=Halobacteroides halobius (strain ATCC 35273 / DSM 5150 / MD-1) TaxID=748449 RepID=L0KD94_HALHC|nr:TetR/AcrR family transcriptional regulator [Halobacteroides halobius]AGB42063.1 transcriptional regulator [Halobacteroides halobius DSM 5150]
MVNIQNYGIKKKRTLKVFINAAAQIIENKDIEAVTIRKVAEIAGYNSATIYNYFDNSNQLVSLAAIRFINTHYLKTLPDYISQANNCLDKFLLTWECFCEYCFKHPKLYYAVFTENIGEQPNNLFDNYYTLFPEEIKGYPQELTPMIKESNFDKRCQIAIQPCIEKGYFTKQEATQINEMIRLLYQGMLSLFINNRVNYSAEEATQKVMSHIRQIVNSIPSQ